jgi:hypothetical protein
VRKRLDAARLAAPRSTSPRRDTRSAAGRRPRYAIVAIEGSGNARIFRSLRAFLDPLGDWPFGEPLRPAVLRRFAQQAAGTAADVGLVSIGIDGEEPSENCREVAVGPHDLVELTEVSCAVKASPILTGGLR